MQLIIPETWVVTLYWVAGSQFFKGILGAVHLMFQHHILETTRVIPKVMSNIFLHANWEQQTKESAVVDGTSCCVILECLVMPIACIT